MVQTVMSKSTSEPKKQSRPKPTDKQLEIFEKLKEILAKHVPPLTAVESSQRGYELVSKKPVEFLGKKRPEMYFGAVMIQSSYVGLYLMHVYVKPERLNGLAPDLKKLLKGKSCFHIKTLDNSLIKQIEAAVKDGVDCYRKLGFI
jgi:hypothetical protein